MKLIDKIANSLGYYKSSRMADIFSGDSKYLLSDYGQPVPENYNKLLKAYQNEVWIYACTYLIATTIAGLPWRLYKEKKSSDKSEKETVRNDEVCDLFNHPNMNDENSTWFNLIEMTVANQELIGNAYWLLDELYGNPQKPKSIQNFIASKIRVVPGQEGTLIDGYNYLLNNGEIKKYTPDEITHFKYMSVTNYHYGQGSMSPALYSTDTIKAAQVANLNIFKNGLKIDSFFQTDQGLSDVVYKRVKQQIHDRYAGSEKAHTTGILEKGLKYAPVTSNMKDLEFINGIKLSRNDICAVHGVPPLLVGILDEASYSNYETAVKVFFIFCIIPKLKRLNQVITTIVKRFDKNLFFEFDISNVDALKEDEQRKSVIAKTYFDMGVPFNIINQRLGLGFEHIEGGDTGFLPFSLQPTIMAAEGRPEPTPEAPVEESEEEQEDEEGKSKSFSKFVYNKEIKLSLWKQFDKTATLIENRYMKIIETFFIGLEMSILRKLDRGKSAKDILKKINVETYLYDEGDEIIRWSKQSEKVHKLSMKTNGDRELINLGLSGTFDVSNPRVTRFLHQYGLSRAKDVIGSNRDEVKKALIQGVDNGESIEDLKKRIQKVFIPYTDEGYKATRIARTEVIGASNQGAVEAYKQSGIKVKKAWLAQPDARDTHIEASMVYNEDNAIDVNKDFQVGGGQGNAPGQIGLAEEDINCRCSVIPVVEK